jgi:hypothetical protein
LRDEIDKEEFEEIRKDYTGIETDYHHVDACTMYMVTKPKIYDVIVTTNMFGDIITDLGGTINGKHGVKGKFTFTGAWSLLDDWYDFKWVNVEVGYAVDGQAQDSDPVVLASLPKSARRLINSSADLYARVKRLDEGTLETEVPQSPARALMGRLERGLGGQSV